MLATKQLTPALMETRRTFILNRSRESKDKLSDKEMFTLSKHHKIVLESNDNVLKDPDFVVQAVQMAKIIPHSVWCIILGNKGKHDPRLVDFAEYIVTSVKLTPMFTHIRSTDAVQENIPLDEKGLPEAYDKLVTLSSKGFSDSKYVGFITHLLSRENGFRTMVIANYVFCSVLNALNWNDATQEDIDHELSKISNN